MINQTIVLEKFVSCQFTHSEHILKTNYISFILKWVGYACFNNRKGVDEPRSFNCLNTLHFSILLVILLSNTNYTYKDCETAKLKDFFVMSI